MHKSESLTCPYVKCGRVFQQPLMLTDMSKVPRETYYACPHCLTKVEISVKDQSNWETVSVKTSENAEEGPLLGCPHQFGYLKTLPEDSSIPDECLTCSRIIQCFVKKGNG